MVKRFPPRPTAATMQEALIFDCDGTLADTMPIHYRAWLDILRPFGAPFPEERFYAWAGIPTREISRRLCAEHGIEVDPVELLRKKEEAFLEHVKLVQPLEHVVAVARARRTVVPMAVASGGYRHVVELTLRHLGILDWFGAVVTAEDTTRHKPEPDVFLEAARRLGVPPSACTVYEDADLGIEAARRAGMRWVDVRAML
jgi:HAD superfamily hydrolase (TIGR01509 family)